MEISMRELVVGGFYKHFKNKLYQVKCIAYHSETKEKLVVYQALYGDFSVYVRPYDMFMSEVDRQKYPEVSQKYRFEQVELDGNAMPHVNQEVKDVELEEKIDSRLERFLDARTYQDKLDVLAELSNDLDDEIIDMIAASIEVEVPEGSIASRYASLKNCILTHAKYECTRLR